MRGAARLWPLVPLAAALAAILWLGAAGAVLAAIVGALALVWRYDNWTGSCFMLAILVLVSVGILVLLLALMAIRR